MDPRHQGATQKKKEETERALKDAQDWAADSGNNVRIAGQQSSHYTQDAMRYGAPPLRRHPKEAEDLYQAQFGAPQQPHYQGGGFGQGRDYDQPREMRPLAPMPPSSAPGQQGWPINAQYHHHHQQPLAPADTQPRPRIAHSEALGVGSYRPTAGPEADAAEAGRRYLEAYGRDDGSSRPGDAFY